MTTETRLVGKTAENIFLSILNEKGIFSHTFDTECFDGIVFDLKNTYFKRGTSPFFVQIECRGSKTNKPNPKGEEPGTFHKIKVMAKNLKINEKSLYFVAGFYINSDIRQITFYIIPFDLLKYFKNKGNKQFRFSKEKCERAVQRYSDIIRL
jgi:hypothetical protein